MKAQRYPVRSSWIAAFDPSRERSDWISKYLELADRVIQAHVPPVAKESTTH